MDEAKIQAQYFDNVISYVASNRQANAHLWTWLQANYRTTIDRSCFSPHRVCRKLKTESRPIQERNLLRCTDVCLRTTLANSLLGAAYLVSAIVKVDISVEHLTDHFLSYDTIR